MYTQKGLHAGESFEYDQDIELGTDFDPDMLADDAQYTICCVVMRLTFILRTKAAD